MARAARKRPTSKREVGAAILDLGKSAKPGKKNKTSQDKASRDKAKQKKAKLLEKILTKKLFSKTVFNAKIKL